MDIKSKSFKKTVYGLVFAVCVISFLGSLTGIGLIYNSVGNLSYDQSVDDLLFSDHYQNGIAMQREFDQKLDTVLYVLNQYKSEEYIKGGGTVSEERLDNAVRSFYYNKVCGDSYYVDLYGDQYRDQNGNQYDYQQIRDQFMKDHADQVEEIRKSMIMDDLRGFREYQKDLEETKGFTYYAANGTAMVTNLPMTTSSSGVDVSSFQKKPAYLIYRNGEMVKQPSQNGGQNGWIQGSDRLLEDRLDSEYEPDLKVFVSFDKDFLAVKEASFAAAKAEMMKWLPLTLVFGVIAFVSFLYLIIFAGRKDENGNRPVYHIDRLVTELQLLLIAAFFFGGGAGFGTFMLETVHYGFYFNHSLYVNNGSLVLAVSLAALIGLFSAGAGLLLILSCVRNIKSGKFVRNSITYIILSSIFESVKTLWFGSGLMKKVVLVTLVVCIGSATVVFAPVLAILIIVITPKWVKKFEEVKKGVEEVKNGNLTYKIPADGEGELDRLAKGINEISKASNAAIQNELKQQRMKTDLISNVSHDLKTPLTSIITYIDLLKREGMDSPEAPKYLDILDQKSIRLKKLTEDLFDAAKASSGAIPVKLERVDLLSLMNQGLGEMNDRIEASDLEFKINAEKEKYYVHADGQLLWRVLENLLGNVLKYAQENSRVYIDLKEQRGVEGKRPVTILEIKNISKAELNIRAEELMERFKRGDESRTTEGSGLGLAIARDLVRLQNGWFELKIDGDLFKAVVMLESLPSEES